jgi:hypothetical protein
VKLGETSGAGVEDGAVFILPAFVFTGANCENFPVN